MHISVIIPSFTPGDYLWECLDSLRCQTIEKSEVEIIIVLNGEREPYMTQITQYVSANLHEYKVNLIYSELSGVSNARNIALDCASGEYICFIDDDDKISQTFLEDLLAVADRDTVALSNTIAFDDSYPEQPLAYHVSDAFNQMYGKDNLKIYSKIRTYFSGPCMKLIHRDIIGDRRFELKLTIGEDSVFMFQISDRIKKIMLALPKAVYYRRFRENSALTAKKTNVEIFNQSLKCMSSYTKAYFSGGYNLIFYITRMLAELRQFLFRPTCCNIISRN